MTTSLSSAGTLASLIEAKLAALTVRDSGTYAVPSTDPLGVAAHGGYSGFLDVAYDFVIDSVSPDNGLAYDTFKWRRTTTAGTSSYATLNQCGPAAYTALGDGLTVTWNQATGHVLNSNTCHISFVATVLNGLIQVPYSLPTEQAVADIITKYPQMTPAAFLSISSYKEDTQDDKGQAIIRPSGLRYIRLGVVVGNADLDTGAEMLDVVEDAIAQALTDRLFPVNGATGYSGRFFSGKTWDAWIMDSITDYAYPNGALVKLFSGYAHERTAGVSY